MIEPAIRAVREFESAEIRLYLPTLETVQAAQEAAQAQ